MNMLDDPHNTQALLLLHLAGELPTHQSAELEQQLAADPALRQSLDEMRHLNEGLTQVIGQCDDFAIRAINRDSRRQATVRQISRAMVRRQLQESVAAANSPVEKIKPFRFRKWSFSVAAAVAIVGFSILYLSGPRTHDATESRMPESDSVAEVHAPLIDVVTDGDRDILSISQGSYDVSSMFTPTQND